MSELVVITFETAEEAMKVRDLFKQQQKDGRMSLDDAAVITKEADGSIKVRDEVDRGVKVGAGIGGVMGLLLGSVFFPIGGLVLGAAGGALVGAFTNHGLDKKFIKEVTDSLEPNSSALFVIIRSGEPDFVAAALRPYKGQVLQTTLTPEMEEALQDALKKRS